MADEKKTGGERAKLTKVLADLYKDKLKDKLKTSSENVKETSKSLQNTEVMDLLKREYFKTRRVHEIGEGAYLITEALFSNQYLFVGEKKALLIDTGLGVAGLKDEVRSLIGKKSLIVVASHASPWTLGGAGEFDKVYLAKQDLTLAKWNSNYRYRKFLFFLDPFRYLLNLSDDDLVKSTGKFKAFDKSREWDLGGRIVKAHATPAQTMGAVTFRDDKTHIVVSGDVTSPFAFLAGPHAASLEQYGKSIEKVESLDASGKNYGTHLPEPIHSRQTADMRILVKGLADSVNDTDRLLSVKTTAGFRRILVYAPYRIRKKSFKDKLEKIWND